MDAAASAVETAESQLRQATSAVGYATLKADVAGIAFYCGPFGGHAGAVYSVGFSPDGARVLSGGEDGTLKMSSPDNKRSSEQTFDHCEVAPRHRWRVIGFAT